MTTKEILPSAGNRVILIALLAAAYFLTGWCGLALAIPPGYATAIFPASGIALAAVLLWGRQVWPGVFLGSFVLNLWISQGAAEISFATLVVPAVIAAGAALQCLVGAYLVRRFVSSGLALDDEGDIVRFLALGGPLGCLVSASVGVATLGLAGLIGSGEVAFSWFTWWVGDSIGVLIASPLAFTLIAEPQEVWRKRRTTVAFPSAVALAVVISVFLLANSWEVDRLRFGFNDKVTEIGQALKTSFKSYRAVVSSIERFYKSSENITQSEFKTFVEGVFEEYPGIQALEWIPRVKEEDREAFEASRRQAGNRPFAIKERNAAGIMVPVQARDSYFPVTFVEPLRGNEKALGFDLGSNPARRQALAKARDAGKQVATSRIRLVQETGQQFGFLLFQPIYRGGGARETLEGRRTLLLGFALGVFRVGDMIESVLGTIDREHIVLSVDDMSAPEKLRHLYGPVADNQEKDGEADIWSITVPVQQADRRWLLKFSPAKDYFLARRAWEPWLVLCGGLLFVSILQMLLLVLTGRTARTEHLVAERTDELAQSERRVRAIVDNVLDGIIIIDEQGRIETINPAVGQIFGYADTELVSENVRMLMPEPNRSNHDSYLSHYRESGEKHIIGAIRELEAQRRDGSTFPIELGVTELVMSGDRVFVGIVRDITERKEIDRMKSEFVSTVSHELRTPLTSIMGSLGLISGGALGEMPGKAKDLIGLAHKNTERLINLVNDILDMEKLQSGRMNFDFRPLDLSRLVRDSLETNKGFADRHGVEFKVTGDWPAVTVRGDSDRLAQVLSNLLSNAAKFSGDGDVVEVSLVRRGGMARVSVKDKGPGISQEFRQRIFDRFAQENTSDDRHKSGTGLGLNISKAIVEHHQGSIDFDTEAGVGSSFFFDLPEAESHEPAETPPRTIETPSPAARRVLICEDDADIAMVLAAMLEEAGLACDVARDANDARKRLSQDRYDAMTIDLLLPGQDGLSLIRDLRTRQETRDLPIVVVSAIADEARRKAAAAPFGIIDWLEKPLKRENLVSAIDRAVFRQGPGKPKILYVEDDEDLIAVVSALLSRCPPAQCPARAFGQRRGINREIVKLEPMAVGQGRSAWAKPLLFGHYDRIPRLVVQQSLMVKGDQGIAGKFRRQAGKGFRRLGGACRHQVVGGQVALHHGALHFGLGQGLEGFRSLRLAFQNQLCHRSADEVLASLCRGATDAEVGSEMLVDAFEPGRRVDGIAMCRVVKEVAAAEISHHHRARVDTDPGLAQGDTFGVQVGGVGPSPGVELQGTIDGALGMVRLLDGGRKNDRQGVADHFVQGATVVEGDGDHAVDVFVEDGVQQFGVCTLYQRCKTGKIGEDERTVLSPGGHRPALGIADDGLDQIG